MQGLGDRGVQGLARHAMQQVADRRLAVPQTFAEVGKLSQA
jgi:hypothetical protein